MSYSANVKRNVQLAFEDALETLDALGREPTNGEETGLVKALCSMACGQYILAAHEVMQVGAAIKKGRPGPSNWKVRVTKEKLRVALTHIRIHR